MDDTDISLIPVVAAAVVRQLAALAGLDGVKLTVGSPSQDDRATELIYLDDIEQWDIDQRVLSGGKATVSRDEEFVLEWVIEVRSKTSPADSFVRAFEIHDELALHVAENPRLGGIDGLVSATLTSGTVEFSQAERKPVTKIINHLTIKGKLRS